MIIPVRVAATLMPVLASERRFNVSPGHPLDDQPCPVCDKPIGEGVAVLVFAGIDPEDRKPGGYTTGEAVAVHALCAGVPEEAPDEQETAPQEAAEAEDETPGYWQVRTALSGTIHALQIVTLGADAKLATMAKEALAKADAIMAAASDASAEPAGLVDAILLNSGDDIEPGETPEDLAVRYVRALENQRDEARAERDDLAARLRATDQSWAKIAIECDDLRAERDQARAVVAEMCAPLGADRHREEDELIPQWRERAGLGEVTP